METFESFSHRLIEWLRPLYVTPHVMGGHDLTHVTGVEKLGLRILAFLNFDFGEYRVAAWLHNVDRCPALKQGIEARGGLKGYLESVLEDSPFEGEARDRIVRAVLEHGKRDDEPGDSSLLTALRIADKVDRFTPLNLIAGAAHRGNKLPLYDPRQPFGYRTCADSILKFYFWNLEWVGMLPSDEARGLIDTQYMQVFLRFLRALGRDIAERCGIENRVEEDIRTALGVHYERWAPGN